MATFEPAGDLEDQLREAVKDQVAEICEDIAANAEANLVFPGSKSGPVIVLTSGLNFAVSNVGPMGHLDEWGSVNNPPYAPLRRAVEASGLEFDEI